MALTENSIDIKLIISPQMSRVHAFQGESIMVHVYTYIHISKSASFQKQLKHSHECQRAAREISDKGC